MYFFCEFLELPYVSKMWLVQGSEEAFLAGTEMNRTGFSCCMDPELEQVLLSFLGAQNGTIYFRRKQQGSALIRNKDGQEFIVGGNIIEEILGAIDQNFEIWDLSTLSLDEFEDLRFASQGEVLVSVWDTAPAT